LIEEWAKPQPCYYLGSNKTSMLGYLISLTISTAVYALFALGLNLQWGFAGLINFGHVAFMTLGAYSTALLTLQGVPIIIAVIVGMGIASLLGLLIGFSTLRLREDYLAIVTIGVSELIRLVANNEEWLTKGSYGVYGYPLPLDFNPNLFSKAVMILLFTLIAIGAEWLLSRSLKQQWRENQEIQGKSYQPTKKIVLILWAAIATIIIVALYVNGVIALSNYSYKAGLMLLVLIVLALVYVGLDGLESSPWGRILKAIREDEEIPRALGKNVFWYKLQAFMLGGAIAGLAGAFFAWQLTTVFPTNFEPLLTFNAWIIVVLGGAGSNAGTLLGAIVFWTYDSITRELPKWLPILINQIAPNLILNETQLDTQISAFRIMFIGLILMVLMIWRPQGILGRKEELTLGR
jgi:neutral amino acid transport system permease protein